MAQQQDSWTTTSGLLDDYELTITEAWFAKDANYQNGEILIFRIKGTTDSDDTPDIEESYPCGRGWESLDGGKTARHESGKQRGFNKQTAYGQLIDRCVELGLGETLRSRGDAWEAKVWPGLRFHIKREEQEFSIKGETRKVSRPLPVAFLGEGGASEGAGATSAPAPASNGAATNGTVDKVLQAKLKSAANKAGSSTEFIDLAMEIPGVTDDDELLNRVLDETASGLYAELKG